MIKSSISQTNRPAIIIMIIKALAMTMVITLAILTSLNFKLKSLASPLVCLVMLVLDDPADQDDGRRNGDDVDNGHVMIMAMMVMMIMKMMLMNWCIPACSVKVVRAPQAAIRATLSSAL